METNSASALNSFTNVLCHFFIESLVDSREYTAIHQFFDHVLGFNIKLLRQILDGQAFCQRYLAVFSRCLGFRLRPYEWAIEFLFCLTLVTL
jgi:hypothetical protein